MAKKVTIIGAGTAGLAAGIRLLKNGYEVDICERLPQAGGKMNQIKEQGFTFDVGPTIVMMPDIYREIFEYAGRNPEDYIPMKRLDPMYVLTFSDGEQQRVSSELTELTGMLESISPEDTLGYFNYLADVYKRYLVAKDEFIDKSFRDRGDFYNLKSLANAMKLKTFDDAYTSISKFVKNENLRKALAFQTLYIGISPYQGPSIYTIIPMIELLYGVWYMPGGMYTMAEGMVRLFEELGGTLRLDTPVDCIDIENGRAVGVHIGDTVESPDYIVCSADFPYVMKSLVHNVEAKGKYTDDKIDELEYSCSCFLLYLGLDKKIPDLAVHNIRFGGDFDQNVREIFETYTLPDDPSIYLYLPSKIDASMAPEGCEALYVLVPVSELSKGDVLWDSRTIKAYREKILDKLSAIPGLEDIESHIVFEKSLTPLDFQDTFHAYNGATFGLKPTLFQSNYFRPHTKADHCEGLYFCGSSVHPGAGVPIVLTSAKLAVDELLRDDGLL